MRKVIVAVAPVGAELPDEVKNPLAAEEVAEQVVAAGRAGAAVVHLHVRDSQGMPTEDLAEFSRTLDLIRAESDIIIQGSTGGVSELSLEARCVALEDSRVETASLNMGSVNFDEGVYVNTLPDIRYWAGRMRRAGVQPELQIFEGGMVSNVRILAEEGCLAPPFVFAFCLGFRGALPASDYSLQFLAGMLPPDSLWGLTHHGMQDFSLLATALGMGATTVRVGFEDSICSAPGRTAKTNAELVEQLTKLVGHLGFEVATPAEARKLLRLDQSRAKGAEQIA